ncbi:MAG: glycosyltransferase [Clostridia bacterium]|nr:glycosyltransferase [Clostridia bacterium]
MTFSICIPMYNEADAADRCLSALVEKMNRIRKRSGVDYEIIVCDDGSTDDTRARVERAAGAERRIRVTGYETNRGKGCAVRTAMSLCRGEIVLYTDCDLAYGTDVIEEALELMSGDGAGDILIGSRNITDDGYRGYGLVRKTASKFYAFLLRVIGGLSFTDFQCGFKVFRRDAAREVFSLCRCDGFAFDYEVLMVAAKYGYTVTEMPVEIVNNGNSSVRVFRDSIPMIKDVMRIKRRLRKLKIYTGG